MVKSKSSPTVFLALLAGFAVLTGCAGEGGDPEIGRNNVNQTEETTEEPPPLTPIQELGTFPGLDAETEKQIKQALVAGWGGSPARWENVCILDYYFGNYNGCIVVIFRNDMGPTGHIVAAKEFSVMGGTIFA